MHHCPYAHHGGEKNRPSKKTYDWFNAIMGKFNPDDIAEVSYFMAFNMPVNGTQRGKGRLFFDAERGPINDFHFTAW